MIPFDLAGKAVVVTGGTRGLGKAIGVEFARAGADVFLTHRWGSVSEVELKAEFTDQGLKAPTIIESDASDPEAIRDLMAHVREHGRPLHAVVSNVAFAKIVHELADLKKNVLDLSLGYSAWPMVELALASKKVLGAYPRYLIGVSGDGARVCHEGYDLAGASKAVLETLCRYLAVRLKSEGTRVNCIVPHMFDSKSFGETFGDAVLSKLSSSKGELIDTARVAQVCLALCSGLMDAVTGQSIVVDEGWSLVSPITLATGFKVPFAFPDEEKST
jgi:NAD(P)-dependent dehydrogenase (short-subunit alcohol dehydrogenase family)